MELAYLGAILAVVAWGTFTVPMKSKSVARAQLDPVVFQLFMSLGITLSSGAMLLLLPELRQPDVLRWTWWALLSASLWVPASLLSFLCVRDIGIALGQGVWAGCVALVSFLWGQIYFRAGMADPILGSLGIAVLVIGISSLGMISGGGCGGAAAEPVPAEQLGESVEPLEPVSECGAGGGLKDPLVALDAHAESPADVAAARSDGHSPSKRTARGLLLAVGVGLGAGSTMVPLRLAPQYPYHAAGLRPLSFAVCFGPCTLAVTACILCVYLPIRRRLGLRPPALELRTCLLPSMTSGAMWSVGNAGGTLASQPPLGLTVGYPITQSCLLVAAICGIVLYKEVRGTRSIALFLVAALVVVSGAALLGVYGEAAPAPHGNSSNATVP